MKKTWTENDFEQMGWHDSHIHSIQYSSEKFKLILDIDYIFEWIKIDETLYNFSVSPATLIFENVWDLKMEIEEWSSFEINEIIRNNPQKPKNAEYLNKDLEWDWQIDIFHGDISFKSIGYTQVIRKTSVVQESQILDRPELEDYLKMIDSSQRTTLLL